LIYIVNILGSTLLKVGLCQQKLGALERDFATSATQAFVDPLKKFMESDLKVSLKVHWYCVEPGVY
jgi:endophilin-B